MRSNGVVYHYCSTETFFSIMSNKNIRLSDITKTNDYLEKEWSIRLLDRILEEKLTSIFNTREIDFNPYKNDEILGYGNFFDIFKVCQETFLQSPAFTTCFSKDGDLLSQWRAYAADGTGIAIGFDAKFFTGLEALNSDIYFADVIYDEQIQIKEIDKLLNRYFDDLNKEYTLKKVTSSFGSFIEDNNDWICPQLVITLMPINYSMKNHAFKEECEKRLVFLPRILDIDDYDRYCFSSTELGDFYISPFKYRPDKDQIIAYCDLDFSKAINGGIVKEIITGPKFKAVEYEMIRFMESLGYKTNSLKVRASKASYR